MLVSISLGGAPFDDCGLNIDFVLELEAPHPSSQVIRYRKFFRRVSHVMLLVSPNRFLVSVNQDSPSREGRAFTLG